MAPFLPGGGFCLWQIVLYGSMEMATLSPPAGSRIWETCPVCATARATPFVAFTALAFVRCDGCATVYKRFEALQPKPKALLGPSASPERRFAHRVRKAKSWLLTALQFGEATTLLSVGRSSNYVLEAGKRLGLMSTGVDDSVRTVASCRQRGHRAEMGTVDKLPFDDGSFELVTLQHVLEHTPHPKEALGEIRRICADRALLVVAVPNLEYWKGLARRWTYRYFRPDALGHQRYVYYTQRSLEQLLAAEGFEVVSRGKAVYRSRRAEGSAPRRAWEATRFAALACGYWVARGLRIQRELFVVAVKAAPSTSLPG